MFKFLITVKPTVESATSLKELALTGPQAVALRDLLIVMLDNGRVKAVEAIEGLSITRM